MSARRLAAGTVVAGMVAGAMVLAAVIPPPAEAAGGTWSAPEVLWSSPSGVSEPSGLTQVVDSHGVVTAAWLVGAGSSSRLLAARLGKGGWSKPRAVASAPTALRNVTFRMVVGPKDDVVLALAVASSAGVRISAARFAAGAWSAPVVLGDYPDSSAYDFAGVLGLSAIADGTGVSVMWQVHARGASVALIVARGLPSGAGDWTAATALDDQATGTFSLVRDGIGTVRASWLHGPDVVSVQGSSTGWGARETIGASGAVGGPADWSYRSPLPGTKAAADVDGTVLVAWTPSAATGTCSTTLAALRTSSGWAPALAVPMLPAAGQCAPEVRPFVGGGLPPTVVGVHSERWVDWLMSATTWSGSAWVPADQVAGQPHAVGSSLLALRRVWDINAHGTRPDVSWLTSSSLAGGGWSQPQRISDASWGWVEDYVSAGGPDGSFVVIYSKLRPWKYNGVWSVTYSNGKWSKALVVAPRVRTAKGSFGALLAAPVVGPDGAVTAAWVLDGKVLASVRR